MAEELFQIRSTDNSLWTTVVFLVFMAMIAMMRIVYDGKFTEFIKLVFSSEHVHVYKDGDTLFSGFMFWMFLLQVIAYSFFIQLSLSYFNYTSMDNWQFFLLLVGFLIVFFSIKLLIDMMIGVIFNAQKLINQYNYIKANYRAHSSLFLLPISYVMYYYELILRNTLQIMIFIVLIVNILLLIMAIKKFQKLFFDRLFYFILYICAQEIAPYIFVYFLFNNLKTIMI